jgi:hypothetical protein
MIRFAVIVLVLVIPLWAPWMDSGGADALSQQVFDAFGPVPSACYDSDGALLQDGLDVRWYPFGRMVHTCSGDYVVWMWGAVREQGGVYKRSEEIRPVQSRALSCKEVLELGDVRRGTSTDSKIVYYEGEPAAELDLSIFPEAEAHQSVIRAALRKGPNFAGSFSVAEWGCGASCQGHAVTDVETGLVVAYGLQTEYGITFALDSTLMVTNPIETLPELPQTRYETESLALAIARVPREYYLLTTDALSGTQYMVRECVESAFAGYIEMEDDRLGVIAEEEEPE